MSSPLGPAVQRARAVAPVVIRPRGPEWKWARRVGAELLVPDEGRRMFAVRLAARARPVRALFADGAPAPERAAAVTSLARSVDDGEVWHREARLRSYDDISLEVVMIRLIAELLELPLPELTTLLVGEPDPSRAALVAHAEVLLAAGAPGEAVDVARRAHRQQSACLTSERLLLRALQADPATDPDDPDLAAATLDLTGRFCPAPFSYLSTGWAGETFACLCPSWVPYSIGNIHEVDDADALWNSPVAHELRRSILDGDYSYCSRLHCSYISADLLPRTEDVQQPHVLEAIATQQTQVDVAPSMVELNHDPTCNLACPSCRTELMTADAESRQRDQATAERVLLPLLRLVDGSAYISGGGEAFSSPHYRSILAAINRRDFPTLALDVITNGQLLTPERWATTPELGPSVGRLSVSLDAATAETYERLRPPGRWEPVRRNLDFVADLRRRGEIGTFRLNFVVQRDNFREIPAFLELGDELGVDLVWFQRLTNYGTYDQATFDELDVSARTHPDHDELCEILRRPELASERVDMQMLLALVPDVAGSPSQERYTDGLAGFAPRL